MYGISELWMGGAIANPDDMMWYDYVNYKNNLSIYNRFRNDSSIAVTDEIDYKQGWKKSRFF